MEWTPEKEEEFWEKCGIYELSDDRWSYPDCGIRSKPDIHDLNALFKYAVPVAKKLKPKGWLTGTIQGIFEEYSLNDRDFALALAEALWKALETNDG